MPLCSLCKGIPWDSLPDVPPNLSKYLTGHEYVQPFADWPKTERGHPHHPNLEALRESASSCGLCQMILTSVNDIEKQLQELKPKWEANQMMEYAWPTYDLFIVKREQGGDGCWVMSFVEDNDSNRSQQRRERDVEEARIIAALGICVRDGNPTSSDEF